MENDETDSFYEADSVSVGASSSVTDDSSAASVSQLGVRRGSACRQLHPLPTIQQVEQSMGDMAKAKQYVKKVHAQQVVCSDYLLIIITDKSH